MGTPPADERTGPAGPRRRSRRRCSRPRAGVVGTVYGLEQCRCHRRAPPGRPTTRNLDPGTRMRALVISGVGGHALLDHGVPPADPGVTCCWPRWPSGCAPPTWSCLTAQWCTCATGRTQLPLVPGHEWVAPVVDRGAPGSGFAVGDVVGGVQHRLRRLPRVRLGRLPRVPAAAGDRRNEPRRRSRPAAALPRPQRPRRAAGRGRGGRPLRRADGGRAAGRSTLRRRVPLARARRGRWHPRLACRCGLPRPPGRRGRRPGAQCRSHGRLAALGVRATEAEEVFDVVLEASGSRGGVAAALDRLGLQRAPGGDRPDRGGVGASGPGPGRGERPGGPGVPLGSPDVWPQALELLGRGRVRPSALVTHRYPLEAVGEAVATMRDRAPGTGKVLVLP